MKIVIAETVLLGREAFETLGEVLVVPDREISPLHLKDADALIVRSKAKIDESLLRDSSVQFIGTGTAGFDHFDTNYFEQNKIAWCAAPGCNANSVSEYVFTALLELHQRHGIELAGKTIGIIGVGEVGSRVAKKAESLGLRLLLNDPIVEAKFKANPDFEAKIDPSKFGGFKNLDEILRESDIVTIHTPLTKTGTAPTFEMANENFFAKLKPNAIFINASRGKVVKNSSLIDAKDRKIVDHAIIDVWYEEPIFSLDLLQIADIASPHIAGHSFEGTLNGTIACYETMCNHFGLEPCWNPNEFLKVVPEISVDALDKNDEDVLWEIVSQAYPIVDDDSALRDAAIDDDFERGENFDYLRKTYYKRREFMNFTVHAKNASDELLKKISGLGFKTES